MPHRRWASHISVSKKESKYQKYIHKSIAKYGVDNFWFRCIDFELSEDKVLEQERYWIQLFDTTNPVKGYNLTLGGEGKSGYKHTDKTRKILSTLASKRVKERNPFYGKTHSKNARDKMRKSRRKISSESIEYLIQSYKEGKLVKDLAKEIGISKSHAYDIIKGKYWRNNHV